MGQRLIGAAALAAEVELGGELSLGQAELALANMTDLTDRISEIDTILQNPGSDEAKQLISNYEGAEILNDPFRLEQYMSRLKTDRDAYQEDYRRLSDAYDRASATVKETMREDLQHYDTTERSGLYKRLKPIEDALEREQIEITRLEGERKHNAETVWTDPEIQEKTEDLNAADRMEYERNRDWDTFADDISLSDEKREQLRQHYDIYTATRTRIEDRQDSMRELEARKERELGVAYTYDDTFQNRRDAKINLNAAQDRLKELNDKRTRGPLSIRDNFERRLLLGEGELRKVTVKSRAEQHYRNIEENIARIETRLNELKADDRIKEFSTGERERLKSLRKELAAVETYSTMRRVIDHPGLSTDDAGEIIKRTIPIADLKRRVDVLDNKIKTPKEKDYVIQQQRLDRLMRYVTGEEEGDLASKVSNLQWGATHRIHDEWQLSLLGTRRTMSETELTQAESFDKRVLKETKQRYGVDAEAGRLITERNSRLREEDDKAVQRMNVALKSLDSGTISQQQYDEYKTRITQQTTEAQSRVRDEFNRQLRDRYRQLESGVRSDPNMLTIADKSGTATGGGGGISREVRESLFTQMRHNRDEHKEASDALYQNEDRAKATSDSRALAAQRALQTRLIAKKEQLENLLLRASYMSSENARQVKRDIRDVDIRIGDLHAKQSQLSPEVQRVLRLEEQQRVIQSQLDWQGGGGIQIDQAREALQKQSERRMKLTEADRQLLARYAKFDPQWKSQNRQVEEQYGRQKDKWEQVRRSLDPDTAEYKEEERIWNEAQTEYLYRKYRLSIELSRVAKSGLQEAINKNESEYNTLLEERYDRTNAEMRAWHKPLKRSKADIQRETTGKEALLKDLKNLQENRILAGKERDAFRRRMGTDPTPEQVTEYERLTSNWAELNREMIQKSDALTGYHKRLKNLDPDYVIDTPQEVKDFRHERFERYRRGEPDIDQYTRDYLRGKADEERQIVEGMTTQLQGWEKILATSFTAPPTQVTDAEVFVEGRAIATRRIQDQLDSDTKEIDRLSKEISALQKIRDRETDPQQIQIREAEIQNLETQRAQRQASAESLGEYDRSNFISNLKTRLQEEEKTLSELKGKRDQYSTLSSKVSEYEAEEKRIQQLEQRYHEHLRNNEQQKAQKVLDDLSQASDALGDRLQEDGVDITSLHIQQQELETELFNQKKGTIGQVNKLLNKQQKKIDDLEKEIQESEEQYKSGDLVVPYTGKIIGTDYEEAARKQLQERYEKDKKVYDQVQQYISLDFDEDSKTKLQDMQSRLETLRAETEGDLEGNLQALKKQKSQETLRITRELQERGIEGERLTEILRQHPEVRRIDDEISETAIEQERRIKDGFTADKGKIDELSKLQAEYILALREADKERIERRKNMFKALEEEILPGETASEAYQRLIRPRLEGVFSEKVQQKIDDRQKQLDARIPTRLKTLSKAEKTEKDLRDGLDKTNTEIDKLRSEIPRLRDERERLVQGGKLSDSELQKRTQEIEKLEATLTNLQWSQGNYLSSIKKAQDEHNKAFFDHRDAVNEAQQFRTEGRNKALVDNTNAAIQNFLTRSLEVTETARGLSRIEAEIDAKIDIDIDFEKGTLRTIVERPETQIAGGWQSVRQVEGAEAQTEPGVVPGRSGELVEVGFSERFPVPYYQAQRKFIGTKKQIDEMIQETELGDNLNLIRDKLHYIRTAERMVQRHDDYRKFEQLGDRIKEMGIVLPEVEPPIHLKRQIIRSIEIEDNIRKLENRLAREPDMNKQERLGVEANLSKLRKERGDRQTKQELRTRLSQKLSEHNDTVRKEMSETIELLAKQRAISEKLRANKDFDVTILKTLDAEQTRALLSIPEELTADTLLKKDIGEVQDTYKKMLADSVVNSEISRQQANAYLKIATDEYLSAVNRTADQLSPEALKVRKDIADNRRNSERVLGEQSTALETIRSTKTHRHNTLIPEKLQLESEINTVNARIDQKNADKGDYVNRRLAETQPEVERLNTLRANTQQKLDARRQELINQGHDRERVNRDDQFNTIQRDLRAAEQRLALARQNVSWLESLQKEPGKLPDADVTLEDRTQLSRLQKRLDQTNKAIEESLAKENTAHTKLGGLRLQEKDLQNKLLGDPKDSDDNGLLGQQQKKMVRYNKEIQDRSNDLEDAKRLSEQTQQETVRALQELRRHLPKADDETPIGTEPKVGLMTDKELTRVMSQIESEYRRAVGYPEGLDEYVEFKNRKAVFKTGRPEMVEVVDNLEAAIKKSQADWESEVERQGKRDERQEAIVQKQRREYERLLENLEGFQKQTVDEYVSEAQRRKAEAKEILGMTPEAALREAIRLETVVLPGKRAVLAETAQIIDDDKISALNIREKIDDSKRIIKGLHNQIVDAKTPEQAQELRLRLEKQQQVLQSREDALRIKELTDTQGLSTAAKRRIFTQAVAELETRQRIAETYAFTALAQEGADIRKTILDEMTQSSQTQEQINTLHQQMERLRRQGEEESDGMRSLRTELEKVYSDQTVEGMERRYDLFRSTQQPLDRTADQLQFRSEAEKEATRANESITRLQLDMNKLRAREIAGENVDLERQYLQEQLSGQQRRLSSAEERMKGEERADVSFDELAQSAVWDLLRSESKLSYQAIRAKHIQEQEALKQARGLLQEDFERRRMHTFGTAPGELGDEVREPGPDDTPSVFKRYEELLAPKPELSKYLNTKERMITQETQRVNDLIRDGWDTKADTVQEMENIARSAGIDIQQDYKVEAHKQGITGLEQEITDIGGRVSIEAEDRKTELITEHPYIFREYNDFVTYDQFEKEKSRLGDELKSKEALLEQGTLSARNIDMTTDLIRQGKGPGELSERREEIRQATKDYVERELRRQGRNDLADVYRDKYSESTLKQIPDEYSDLRRELPGLYKNALYNQHDMTLFEARRSFAIGQDPGIVDDPAIQFKDRRALADDIRSREGEVQRAAPAHQALRRQQEKDLADKRTQLEDLNDQGASNLQRIDSLKRELQKEQKAATQYERLLSEGTIGLKDLKYYLDNKGQLDEAQRLATEHRNEVNRLQQRIQTLEGEVVGIQTRIQTAEQEEKDIQTNISTARAQYNMIDGEQRARIRELKGIQKLLDDPERKSPIELVYGKLKDDIADRKESIEDLTKLQEFYTKSIRGRIEKELAEDYEKHFERIIGEKGYIKARQSERDEVMKEAFEKAAEAVLERRLDVSAAQKRKLYDTFREAEKRAPDLPTSTADTIQRAVDMFERQRNATRYRPPMVQEGIKTLQRKIREQKRIVEALKGMEEPQMMQVRQAEHDLAAAQRMLRILQRPEGEAALYRTNARGLTPLTITPIEDSKGKLLSPEDSYREILRRWYFPTDRDDLDKATFEKRVKESKDEISYVEHGDYTLSGRVYSEDGLQRGDVPTSGYPLHPRYEEAVRAGRDVEKLWEHEVDIMKRGPLITAQYKDVFELNDDTIRRIHNRPEVQRAYQTLQDRQKDVDEVKVKYKGGTLSQKAIDILKANAQEKVEAAQRKYDVLRHPIDEYTAENIQKIKRQAFDQAGHKLVAQQMRIQKPYETLPGEKPDNMWMYRYLDLPPTLQVPRLAIPQGREDEIRLWKQVHTDLPQLSQRRTRDPETGRMRLETPFETIARWHSDYGKYGTLTQRIAREPLVDVRGLTSQQIRLRAERANQRSMSYQERQAFFTRQGQLSEARKKLERIEKLKKVTGRDMLTIGEGFEKTTARKRLQEARLDAGEIYSPMERARVLLKQQQKQEERIEELIRQGKYERPGIVETFQRAPEYLYESRQLERDFAREENAIRKLQEGYPESHDALEQSLGAAREQYHERLGTLQSKYPLLTTAQRQAHQAVSRFERAERGTPEQQHVKRARAAVQELRQQYPQYKEEGEDKVKYRQAVSSLLEGTPVSKNIVARGIIPLREGLYPTFWKGYKDSKGTQVVPGFETEMKKAFSTMREEAEALPTRRVQRYRPTSDEIRKRKQVADELRKRRLTARSLEQAEGKQFIGGQGLRTQPVIIPTASQLDEILEATIGRKMSGQEKRRIISQFQQGKRAQEDLQAYERDMERRIQERNTLVPEIRKDLETYHRVVPVQKFEDIAASSSVTEAQEVLKKYRRVDKIIDEKSTRFEDLRGKKRLDFLKSLDKHSEVVARLRKDAIPVDTEGMRRERQEARQLKYRPERKQTVTLVPKLATKERLQQIRDVIQQNRQRITRYRDEQSRERRNARLYRKEHYERTRAKQREQFAIERARRRRGARRGFITGVLKQIQQNIQYHYRAKQRKKRREENLKARAKIRAQQAEQNRRRLLETKITQYQQRARRETISLSEKKYYLRQVGILQKNLKQIQKQEKTNNTQVRY